MSETKRAACPGPDLLLLLAHGLLEGEERDGLTAHLADCGTCQGHRASLEDAMQPPPEAEPPAEVLTALRERIAEHEAHVAAVAKHDVHVSLLCTYCKDDLAAADTIYCASCVAPHHEDCFYEHGLCAAPGCEGRRIVRSVDAPERPADKRGGGRGGLLIVLGIVLGGGAVAAVSGGFADDGPAPQITKEPAPTVTPDEPEPPPEEPQEPGKKKAERLDVSDLIPSGEGEEKNELWKRSYKQILQSRPVTLNFPDTPLSEIVAFLQDITGLNIVVSSDVPADEISVNMRLRDVILEDALAAILELANLSAVFEDEALVIVPFRAEELEQKLERISKEGFESPEAAFEVRKRLQNQQITLSFDETPFTEAIDFLRDITRLNYVIKAPNVEDRTVSLRLRNVSLGSALELILKGTGLGVRLGGSGIVWIVPQAEATEGAERAAQKKALLARDCPGEVLRSGRLSQVAERLRAALGEDGHVVLSDGAFRNTERVILPGSATIAQVLDLVQRQTSLTYAVAWMGETPVLAMDAAGEGPLAKAGRLAGNPTLGRPWPRLHEAWQKARTNLRGSLRGLDATAKGSFSLVKLRAVLEGLEANLKRVSELERLRDALEDATDQALAKARASAAPLLDSYLAKRMELRTTTLAHREVEAKHQKLLAAQRAERTSSEDAYKRELQAANAELEALHQELAALPRDGRADFRAQRTTLRQKIADLEDAQLDLARAFDQKRKELTDSLDALQAETAKRTRDHKLQVARIESESAQLLARTQILLAGVLVLEAHMQLDARLKNGEPHEAVSNADAWLQRTQIEADAATGRAVQVRGTLGASFGPAPEGEDGYQVTSVREGTPAAKAGLQQGDRLPDVASDLDMWLLYARAGKTLEITVVRGGTSITVRIELD